MVNITLRMRHHREWKHSFSNSTQERDPYHIPELYNRNDTRAEEKEIELKLENITELDEGDLENLINKC